MYLALLVLGQREAPVVLAGLELGGTLEVGVVLDELLDAHEDLLYRDAGLPVFFFVEDAQTHGAGRVHVRVRQDWLELACVRRAYTWAAAAGSPEGSPCRACRRRPPRRSGSEAPTSLGPGISQYHLSMLTLPFSSVIGFATKPWVSRRYEGVVFAPVLLSSGYLALHVESGEHDFVGFFLLFH